MTRRLSPAERRARVRMAVSALAEALADILDEFAGDTADEAAVGAPRPASLEPIDEATRAKARKLAGRLGYAARKAAP